MVLRGEGSAFFTTDDRSINATTLVWLSKTVFTLGCEFTDLVDCLVDETESSFSAHAGPERRLSEKVVHLGCRRFE